MTVDRPRKTILLVDDEEAFLLSLAEGVVTVEDSIGVILATDAVTALDMLNQSDVDLLVTDLMMPGLDGFALLETAAERFPDLALMVMTSGGSHEVESRARRIGISDYFEKPINLEDFIASICRVLDGHSGPGIDQGETSDDPIQ